MEQKCTVTGKELTITLPLLEINNNEPWDMNNYGDVEEGLYWVKSKDGLFHLIEKNNSNIWHSCLPANVSNSFVEDLCQLSILEQIKDFFHMFDERNSANFGEIFGYLRDITDKIDASNQDDSKDLIKEISTKIESIKTQQSAEQPKVFGGAISEQTLLDIIRTIK